MAVSGISTLGIKLYAAVSSDGEKVTTASSYSQLTRINSIGEVAVSTESIDSSALEDLVSQFIAGRGSVTENYDIVVNATDATIAEWTGTGDANTLLGKKVCFMTVIPGLTKALFVVAEVPNKIPAPALDQNGLMTFTMSCVTNKFIGFDTAVSLSE